MADVRLETAVAFYQAREAAILTKVELPKRASVTPATITRIERGDNVTIEKHFQIAHVLSKRLKVGFE